ncbi:hypothetical protein ACFL4P_00860 [Gemmatimonadota bacterium]
MNGNICPECGNSVMPYSRFRREAEPFKISACGSCGVKLKRSPKVYAYLLIMTIVLMGIASPLFLVMLEANIAAWIFWMAAILLIASWAILINYLSWRYIGWVVVEQKEK